MHARDSAPHQGHTVIHARWVIPVGPVHQELEHHAVVLQAERIVEVLPSAAARTKYQTARHLERPRHALIPGLINAHTHASMTLLRGIADDLPLQKWLHEHIWPAEERWVSEEFVADGTRLAVAEMVQSGTTCCNDMYFFPEVTAQVCAQAGMRAVVGLIVLDMPSAWAADHHAYLHQGLEVHARYRDHALIRTALAPHAPYSVSNSALEKVRSLAEEHGLPVHMHVHETAHEIAQSLAHYGTRPLTRLQQLGLLSPAFVAVHMTQLEEAEIALLAATGVKVVHCPESNLKLASGFCPVARLLAAGVNVALGTDGAASNNDLNMLGEMHVAALLAKGVAGDAAAVPAAAALRMATLQGAEALGIDGITGSLEPGKAADVVAVDLSGVATQPLYRPTSQLVYASSRDQVSDVWIAGRHLLEDGGLKSLDTAQLLASAHKWQARLAAASC